MPTLRSWHVHHPSDWTERQRYEYAEDTARGLHAAVAVMIQQLSPMTMVNMLLAIVRKIVDENPIVADPACDTLIDVASDVAKKIELTGRTLN